MRHVEFFIEKLTEFLKGFMFIKSQHFEAEFGKMMMKSRVKEIKSTTKFFIMVFFSVFGNISVLRIVILIILCFLLFFKISVIHIYLYIKKTGLDYSKSYLMEMIFGYLSLETTTALLNNFSQEFFLVIFNESLRVKNIFDEFGFINENGFFFRNKEFSKYFIRYLKMFDLI